MRPHKDALFAHMLIATSVVALAVTTSLTLGNARAFANATTGLVVAADGVMLTHDTAATVARNLEALEEERRSLRQELKDAQAQMESLTKERDEAKRSAEEAKAKLDEQTRRADDAEGRVADLTSQLEEINANIRPAPDDIDEANLTIGQSEVGGWAARIDRYLDGTILAGYGQTFAQAACDYGVDPRLSPAIAVLESTAGAYVPAPHNAWGWGGPGNWKSWPDWESAIREHTKGLLDNGYMPFDQAAGTRYCDESYWSHLKPIIEAVGRA